MDYLRQQQLQLQSEVRLLEKQKNDLIYESERADVSASQQQKQFNKIIDDLTHRRDDLTAEIERLREGLELLTDSYTSAKKSLVALREAQMTDIKKELESAKATAQMITDQALLKKHEAQKLLEDTKTEEERLRAWDKQLTDKNNNLRINTDLLNTKIAGDKAKQTELENTFATLTEKITGATREFTQLDIKLIKLRETIATQTVENDRQHKLLDARVSEIDIQEKAITNKENMLNLKEEELKTEAIVLKDRRETLERAIAEYRAKGVTI